MRKFIIITLAATSTLSLSTAHRLPPRYFPLIINGRDQIDCCQDVETKLTVTKM